MHCHLHKTHFWLDARYKLLDWVLIITKKQKTRCPKEQKEQKLMYIGSYNRTLHWSLQTNKVLILSSKQRSSQHESFGRNRAVHIWIVLQRNIALEEKKAEFGCFAASISVNSKSAFIPVSKSGASNKVLSKEAKASLNCSRTTYGKPTNCKTLL